MKGNMKYTELMLTAMEAVDEAKLELKLAFEVGNERPVPADMFTLALRHLRQATSAVTELERAARGGQPADVGEKPLLAT